MSQPVETQIHKYVGNGSTTNFTYNFTIASESEIVVLLNGVVVSDTAYIVNTVDTQIEMDVAPEVDDTLILYRNTELSQPFSFGSSDFTLALDNLERQIQDISEEVGRSFKAAPEDLDANYTIPSPLAGYAIGWNQTEDDLVNLPVADGTLIGATQYKELQTATAGQTVFVVTTIPEVLSPTNTAIYIQGVKQYSTAYSITDSYEVTFNEGLDEGDVVEFVTGEILGSATIAEAHSVPYTSDGTTTVGAKLDITASRYATVAAAQADVANIAIGATIYLEDRGAYFKCVAYTAPNGYDIVDGDGSTKVVQLNYFQGPYTEFFVNPRHLGAVGDGSDETDILNRALSFGSIYLEKPSLYYGISSPLIYNSGVTIEGESGETDGVKIYVLDGSNITGGIFVSSGWYNDNTSLDGPVTIKNIFLHGNKDNQTSGDCAGILSMNYRCLFDRVSIFKMTGDCILLTDQNSAGTTVLSSGVETEIRSCILTQPDGAGIKSVNSGQGLTDGKIHNNFIGNTGEHGIDIERSGGWAITENQIYDTDFSAIYMQGGFNTTVSNNYIQGWGSSAVNSSYYAIAVLSITSDDRPVHISGNNIVQNVSLVSGNTYYAIGVTSATGVTDAQESILNNTVTLVSDASEWFLRVSGSGVSKCNVSGNNVYNLTTRRAITKGASDVVVHSGNSFDIEPQVAQFAGSPDVLHGALFTSAGGGHTISGFSNGYPGQVIRYVFNHSTNTVDFTGTNLYGNVGANWSPAVNDHMTCVCSDGTKWHCDISDNTA